MNKKKKEEINKLEKARDLEIDSLQCRMQEYFPLSSPPWDGVGGNPGLGIQSNGLPKIAVPLTEILEKMKSEPGDGIYVGNSCDMWI